MVGSVCDPTPYLKVRKNRKFMGTQDDLAVTAAGKALSSAGLEEVALGPRAGIYLAVGYIPFEKSDIDDLVAESTRNGCFSMTRFSTKGYAAVNPLLTFRCLSNMPAFHISVNFDVQGSYLVTYPGPAQFYLAVEEAVAALEANRVDIALVGGVAHQENFLVAHHFSRIDYPIAAERLVDAAGCLVLESAAHAANRSVQPLGRLLEWDLSYSAYHPFEETPLPAESFRREGPSGALEDNWLESAMGAASLPVALSLAGGGVFRHQLRSRDGFAAASVWELA